MSAAMTAILSLRANEFVILVLLTDACQDLSYLLPL